MPCAFGGALLLSVVSWPLFRRCRRVSRPLPQRVGFASAPFSEWFVMLLPLAGFVVGLGAACGTSASGVVRHVSAFGRRLFIVADATSTLFDPTRFGLALVRCFGAPGSGIAIHRFVAVSRVVRGRAMWVVPRRRFVVLMSFGRGRFTRMYRSRSIRGVASLAARVAWHLLCVCNAALSV